jgi:dihydrofolate synthase/folylpolyglutamate synthase
MSYSAAIDQLNSMVPELHVPSGQPRRKFSLDEVRILLAALGDPQRSFPSVLIAGTNGKGSTASTLASILTEAGYRTGLYTSPHLELPNERIRIDREEIDDDSFARHYFKAHDKAQELVLAGRLPQLPSYFELLTSLAFLHFAEKEIEIAVLEVGMGGRLDATNVVEPLVSIVTDISLDHTEWLGPTISAITREKAGILRPKGTMITLPQHPEANQALGEVATELAVHGVSAVPYMPPAAARGSYSVEALGTAIEVNSPLHGAHQQRNIALAIAAAVELSNHHGYRVSPSAIAQGVRLTRWPGRLERFEKDGVTWVLDVAHNPAGAWALRAGLRETLGEDSPRTLIFSCLRDKPAAEMAQILFPLFEQIIVVPIRSARSATIDELRAAARTTGTPAVAAESVREAVKNARDRSASSAVVISGSVYLVGEARALLLAADGESS